MLSSVKTEDGRLIVKPSQVDSGFLKIGALVYVPADSAFYQDRLTKLGVTDHPGYGVITDIDHDHGTVDVSMDEVSRTLLIDSIYLSL